MYSAYPPIPSFYTLSEELELETPGQSPHSFSHTTIISCDFSDSCNIWSMTTHSSPDCGSAHPTRGSTSGCSAVRSPLPFTSLPFLPLTWGTRHTTHLHPHSTHFIPSLTRHSRLPPRQLHKDSSTEKQCEGDYATLCASRIPPTNPCITHKANHALHLFSLRNIVE